jgi:D-alanyl-D-alanine carboxypeptidase/D-alanyl-D-alanine-endopeptidase (penicillin-binding protein 4)
MAPEIDLLLSDPSFPQAFWGIKIQELRTGRTLYERNADGLVMPASNMKLVSTATVLQSLDLDFRPKTWLYAAGEIVGDVLEGDLVLVGGGDPSLGGRFAEADPLQESGDPWVAMRDLARGVVEKGIVRITGDIIAVDDFFAEEPLGYGWAWDGLSSGYSAPIGALTWNENVVRIFAEPGAEPGDPATVHVEPDVGALVVEADVRTVGPLSRSRVRAGRDPWSDVLVISGSVAAGGRRWRGQVSAPDPTRFAALGFRVALEEAGIVVGGEVIDQDDLPEAQKPVRIEPDYGLVPAEGVELLMEYEGPRLAELVWLTNKISQNLYAETLLRLPPAVEGGVGSVSAGVSNAESVLLRMGIPASHYVMRDASGLSRYNYLTAEVITRLLRSMARGRQAGAWFASLPVMGVDGTISSRGRGSAIEGRIFAKTGSISNSRALSGYAVRAAGDTLTFSIIANNFTDPTRAVEYLQDLICELLVATDPERDIPPER